MRKSTKWILKIFLIALASTVATLLYKRNIYCTSDNLFTISHKDCQSASIYYFLRGWPIEYYWSNHTGFVATWFLIDLLFFFVIFLILYSLLQYRQQFKKKTK